MRLDVCLGLGLLLRLLELLHRLRPLGSALLHRRVHGRGGDTRPLIEQMVGTARRRLHGPQAVPIGAKGYLIDPLQAVSAGLYRQGRGKIVTLLVWRAPKLTIQAVDVIACLLEERVVGMIRIVQALRRLRRLIVP